MKCSTSCIIAGAFIFSSLFLSLRVNKQTLTSPLFQLLTNENKKRYINIANERKMIYFKGFGLGLILSIITLFYINSKKKLKRLTNICTVFAISFTVNYFFYILYPKSDYMIKHLNSQDEKNAWLKIYKTMQYNYHLGFVLGLIGMIFIGNSFC